MSEELSYDDWADINKTAHLDDLPLRSKIPHIMRGLWQPECQGHHKWAVFQLKRSYAAILGVAVPALITCLIVLIASLVPRKEWLASNPVTLIKPDEKPPRVLKDIDKEAEKLDVPPDTPAGDQLADQLVKNITKDTSSYDDLLPEDPQLADAPNLENAVFLVNSPVKFRMPSKSGIGIRTKRKKALQKYGAPPCSEDAVLLALRWLKKNQNPDGTWGKTKPAITSLVLLTYLAHAETPESEEFGSTVELAIRWLLENQSEDGRFAGSDTHEYSLPIAAYALSEAFSMTRIPDVRYAARKRSPS